MAPDPTPQETERTFTLDAAQFGDDGGGGIWLETSNRSEPFAWDAITADNAAAVRVSIGGVALAGEGRSFTSTALEPSFEGDYSGAEWTVAAEVTAGAVVLVLTAPNQRTTLDRVGRVTVTSPGSGYTSAPTVVFEGGDGSGAAATAALPPRGVDRVTLISVGVYSFTPWVRFAAPQTAGGETATGTVNRQPGADVTGVTITNPGSGYTSPPTVTFQPGLGVNARGNAVLEAAGVTSVTITGEGGSGYASAPTVRFTGGGGGSGAAARAYLARTGYDEVDNLYWARQTLAGKELLLQLPE